MAELNKQNKLEQHFLYTYSNAQKEKPSEHIRNLFNDDLIFDKSRKTIFTQGQEFGYISDTTYSVNINGNYVTLHSYEGTIELYEHKPVEITKVNIVFNDENIAYNSAFNPQLIKIYTTGTGTISYLDIHFNDNSLKQPYNISSVNNVHTITGIPSTYLWKLGENTLDVIIRYTDSTYVNINKNSQHKFAELKTIVSEASYSITFNAYNWVYLLRLTGSYWDIIESSNSVTINNENIVESRLCDDYYTSFLIDHYNCDNIDGETICAAIPQRLENNNEIRCFVGGIATELFKLKEVTYSNEKYNLYIPKSTNWDNLDFWFQKKTQEDDELEPPFDYDYYVEVIAKKSGIIRIWTQNHLIRYPVIANALTRIPIPDDTWRTVGYFHHFIQTGGDQIDTTFVDFSGLGTCLMKDVTTMFQNASTVEIIDFGSLEFDVNAFDEHSDSVFTNCTALHTIRCKQTVKNFLQSTTKIKIPNRFKPGGTGIWEIH